MRQPRGSSLARGRERAARRASMARGAIGAAVISAAVTVALAGCGSPAGPGGGASSPAAAASTPASAPATASGPATPAAGGSGAAAFAPIVEPFGPGHPARPKAAPANCAGQPTTLAIEQCYEARIENVDAAIDAVTRAQYQSASPGARADINALDSAWLAARGPVCAKAFHSGGTIDQVDTARCLLDESTARLAGLRGTQPAEAVLKSTDSTDPSALSWYTSPEGSRIAMIDTQGDKSGGVSIAWVVIGGAQGFVVNPGQFTYVDKSFTDQGKAQTPGSAGHRVSPGAEYQFSMDYSHRSADPYSGKRTGGWVYAPGAPVAVWR